MKAWQFTGTNEPIVRIDAPDPTPGPSEVVLEMKAAGLCHTDVGQLHDESWLSVLAKVPIIMGHENAGKIIEVGEGVTDFKVGDRVAVCPTTPVGAPGHNYDGGWADKLLVEAQTLVPVPDGVDWVSAAAATDAGMTSYSAMVSRGGVKAGQKVCVIGLGGLGQIGARVAVLNGAEVYAAEINEGVWGLAEEIGIKEVRKSIQDYDDIKFDLIVDYAGFGDTTSGAVDAVTFGGTVVLVGMGKLEFNVKTMSMILNKVSLLGSVGGSKEDIAGVLKYMESGDLKPELTKISVEDIPEGLEKLHNGEVRGRLVASFG